MAKYHGRFLHAQRNICHGSIDFYLVDVDSQKRLVGQNVEMADTTGGAEAPPTFRLYPEKAQDLVDELWAAGVRPSQMIEPNNDATRDHLEDMRQIAFSKLELDKPVGR